MRVKFISICGTEPSLSSQSEQSKTPQSELCAKCKMQLKPLYPSIINLYCCSAELLTDIVQSSYLVVVLI